MRCDKIGFEECMERLFSLPHLFDYETLRDMVAYTLKGFQLVDSYNSFHEEDGLTMKKPSYQELRNAGLTLEALNFPLSKEACIWLARFNGIPFEIMPEAWKYAPNDYMRRYIEKQASDGVK